MIDKKLLALLGANKKYIYYTVALMILGLFANLSITAAICRTIELAVNFQQYETARVFLLPGGDCCGGRGGAVCRIPRRGGTARYARPPGKEGAARACVRARSSVSASARRTA